MEEGDEQNSSSKIVLVIGFNMGGKFIFMRQVGLIIVMV